MSFHILEKDITKVHAGAIVDPANPYPTYGGGTDAAIYKAAGAQKLLEERKMIGNIRPGNCAATHAFDLDADYIIHTVGPSWEGGNAGELDILAGCYRNSLECARMLQCRSVAFPLIGTGVYGFPKDKALDIALAVIRDHLEYSELNVTLVVFDRSAYHTASGLTEQIEEFIDENYVGSQTEAEYGSQAGPLSNYEFLRRRRDRGDTAAAFTAAAAPSAAPSFAEAEEAVLREESFRDSAPAFPRPARSGKKKEKSSLEDIVNNLGESFQKRLLRMIDERGMTDPEVYKRANLDRKLFSKIRCSEDYIPKKKTIVALAIALRLNLDDTRDLLASAGLLLTNNSKSDLIVIFCLENGIYDIYEVNALLFKFGEPVLC